MQKYVERKHECIGQMSLKQLQGSYLFAKNDNNFQKSYIAKHGYDPLMTQDSKHLLL